MNIKVILLLISLCLSVFLVTSLMFFKLVEPVVKSDSKPDSIECQRIYAKAKACIEMETASPEKFKYNP